MSTLDCETRLAIMALEGRAREPRTHGGNRAGLVSTVLALASLFLALAVTVRI